MRGFFRSIWIVAYRELLRFVQDPPRLITSFATPLLFLVMFGAGFNRMIGTLSPGINFIQFMFPGVVAMTVLMTALMSGLSIVWDREIGFLREVLVAPLSRSGIVVGKAVGGAAVAVMQGVMMLVLAPLIGVPLSLPLVLELVLALIVVAMSIAGLGVLIAARMRSQQGFHMVMQIVVMPLIFLSGVFFPVNNVPRVLEVLAKLNPFTYGVDAIRQLVLGDQLAAAARMGPAPGVTALGVNVLGHSMGVVEDLALVVAIGSVLMALAIWSFSRQD